MTGDQIQGRWHEINGEAKRLWGDLTDDDLTYVEGDMQKLWGRLQQRYGEKKQGLREEFDRFVGRFGQKKDAA